MEPMQRKIKNENLMIGEDYACLSIAASAVDTHKQALDERLYEWMMDWFEFRSL